MVMHSPGFDSQSSPSRGGTKTRALAVLEDTAQPPLTSGFGTVMEQEEDIQSSTEMCLGANRGANSVVIDRTLRHQGMRLGANMALLEQRYEMLPHPLRFQTLQATHGRLSQAHRTSGVDPVGGLATLIAQHRDLLRKIEALIRQRPDGQRGELILTEIARNHEDMVAVLTALINEDAARDAVPAPVVASRPRTPDARTREANWENEGGAPLDGR